MDEFFPKILFLVDTAQETSYSNEEVYRRIGLGVIRVLLLISSFPERGTTGRLSWGYEFYSSQSARGKTIGLERKTFQSLKSSNLNNFLADLKKKVIKVECGDKTDIAEVYKRTTYALMSLLYQFPWDEPDVLSPNKCKRTLQMKQISVGSAERRTNFIFIVSTCPTPSHHIEEISELTVAKSVKTFISGDLSTQLQRQGIAVFWIDTYIDLIGLKDNKEGSRLVNSFLKAEGGCVIPLSSLIFPFQNSTLGFETNRPWLRFDAQKPPPYERIKNGISIRTKQTSTSKNCLNYQPRAISLRDDGIHQPCKVLGDIEVPFYSCSGQFICYLAGSRVANVEPYHINGKISNSEEKTLNKKFELEGPLKANDHYPLLSHTSKAVLLAAVSPQQISPSWLQPNEVHLFGGFIASREPRDKLLDGSHTCDQRELLTLHNQRKMEEDFQDRECTSSPSKIVYSNISKECTFTPSQLQLGSDIPSYSPSHSSNSHLSSNISTDPPSVWPLSVLVRKLPISPSSKSSSVGQVSPTSGSLRNVHKKVSIVLDRVASPEDLKASPSLRNYVSPEVEAVRGKGKTDGQDEVTHCSPAVREVLKSNTQNVGEEEDECHLKRESVLSKRFQDLSLFLSRNHQIAVLKVFSTDTHGTPFYALLQPVSSLYSMLTCVREDHREHLEALLRELDKSPSQIATSSCAMELPSSGTASEEEVNANLQHLFGHLTDVTAGKDAKEQLFTDNNLKMSSRKVASACLLPWFPFHPQCGINTCDLDVKLVQKRHSSAMLAALKETYHSTSHKGELCIPRDPTALIRDPQENTTTSARDPLVDAATLDRDPLVDAATLDRDPLVDAATLDRDPLVDAATLDRDPQKNTATLDRDPLMDTAALDRDPLMDAATLDRDPLVDAATLDRDPLVDVATLDRDPLVDAATLDKDPLVDAATLDKDPLVDAATLDRDPLVDAVLDAKDTQVALVSMDTSDEPAMFPKMSPLAIELTNCNNLEEVICLFSNFNEQSIRSRGYIEPVDLQLKVLKVIDWLELQLAKFSKSLEQFLENNFFVSNGYLKEHHLGKEQCHSFSRRVHLQLLYRFEMLYRRPPDDLSLEKITTELTAVCRVLLLTPEASFLGELFQEAIIPRYSVKLKDVLIDMYDDLMWPLPSDLADEPQSWPECTEGDTPSLTVSTENRPMDVRELSAVENASCTPQDFLDSIPTVSSVMDSVTAKTSAKTGSSTNKLTKRHKSFHGVISKEIPVVNMKLKVAKKSQDKKIESSKCQRKTEKKSDLCQVKRSLFRPSLSMGTICERKTKSQTLLGNENSPVPESRKRLSSRQTIDGLCGVQSAGSIPTPKRKRSEMQTIALDISCVKETPRRKQVANPLKRKLQRARFKSQRKISPDVSIVVETPKRSKLFYTNHDLSELNKEEIFPKKECSSQNLESLLKGKLKRTRSMPASEMDLTVERLLTDVTVGSPGSPNCSYREMNEENPLCLVQTPLRSESHLRQVAFLDTPTKFAETTATSPNCDTPTISYSLFQTPTSNKSIPSMLLDESPDLFRATQSCNALQVGDEEPLACLESDSLAAFQLCTPPKDYPQNFTEALANMIPTSR